jgi:glycosyltransferase involved in cell wall biosynthesis
VVTLSPESADSRLEDFGSCAEVVSLGLSRLRGVSHGAQRLSQTLANLRVDLAHSQGVRADSMLAGKPLGFPHVLTIRNYVFEDYPVRFGRLRGALLARSHVRALRRAQYPVACARHLAARYAAVRANMAAVPNGVNTARYKPADRTVVRAALNIPANAVVLTYIGSLVRFKAVDRLLAAFATVSQRDSDALLCVVGDGPERRALQAFTKDSRVRFVGTTPRPELYLQAADWSVSASTSEGMPNAVLESLACGTPAMLSDIAAHREIAAVASQACELFTVDSTAALAALLQRAIQRDSDEELRRRRARAAAVQHLSAAVMTDSYQRIYDRLLSATPSR